jgi:predicted DNA-binding protein
MSDAKKVSAPIRMTPEMLAKVQLASEKTGISQADILRLCVSIGLEDLRRINYDLSTAILDASRKSEAVLKVAEEAGNESSLSTAADGVRHPVKYPPGRSRKSS